MNSTELKENLLKNYFNWDAQISVNENSENELTKLEIAQIKRSFQFLRDELGEKFPQECLQNSHPIKHYFLNRAPWTRSWFNWLADAIRESKVSVNWGNLIKKLRSSRHGDFQESISIYEVLLKLKKAGFHIAIEEELVNDSGKRKKPDLTIINQHTSENIFIEVTRLTKNPTMQRHESIMQQVYFGGMDKGLRLQFSGKFFKVLSDEHLNEIENEVEAKLLSCVSHKGFFEINHEGVIELAFAPENDIEILNEWCKIRNYELSTFTLPDFNVLGRVRTKIINKKDQLSSETPNLLVISNEDFWLSKDNYEGVINELLETIYKCPQLLAVVILGGEFGNLEKQISSVGFNFFVQKTDRHAHSSKTLLLFNKFCKAKITPHSLMRIFDAFEKH